MVLVAWPSRRVGTSEATPLPVSRIRAPVAVHRLADSPHRCLWDHSPLWRHRAHLAAQAVPLQGGRLHQWLIDAGLDFVHSHSFADCPVGGSALRLLHVWAAASYHHGWDPTLAFATEAAELAWAPELRLILDVDWSGLLQSMWGHAFFAVLSRLTESLCSRLEGKVHGRCTELEAKLTNAGATEQACDLVAARRALERGSGRKQLKQVRRQISDCAPRGRLSDLMKTPGAALLFKTLASLNVSAASRGDQEHVAMDMPGEVAPLSLGTFAIRAEVVADSLAAIGLAASLREPAAGPPVRKVSAEQVSERRHTVELLVFAERLKSVGHRSGFFNVITENKCEMDFFSHFHRAFCLFPASADHPRPRLTAAAMTSGLLVHPPYGPAAWSCEAAEGLDVTAALHIAVLDPSLWDTPLWLNLQRPRSVPQPQYSFAVCPQPLYRLEANREHLKDWLAYHRRLGVEHVTIYDLDGSGEAVLDGEENVELISRLPDLLGSPLLKAGNSWNPICLEALAQTQCYWRYRGRARWVFNLHSFDEYLVSARNKERALHKLESYVLSRDAWTSVFRIPAVNYGGEPAEGEPVDAPMPQRFTKHTAALYWHIVVANPRFVISVNTTNARAMPPLKHQQYFAPDNFRVNHYVDALGARQRDASVYKHNDRSLAWAWQWLSERRSKRRATIDQWIDGFATPAAVLALRTAKAAALGSEPPAKVDAAIDLLGKSVTALTPASRVALAIAHEHEQRDVGMALGAAFKSGDANGDGFLSLEELRELALPNGWDAHLRRRDLHALGIYLHAWLAEDGDWDASQLLTALDQETSGLNGAARGSSDAAAGDGKVSASEFAVGLLRMCRQREILAVAAALTRHASVAGSTTSASMANAAQAAQQAVANQADVVKALARSYVRAAKEAEAARARAQGFDVKKGGRRSRHQKTIHPIAVGSPVVGVEEPGIRMRAPSPSGGNAIED